jgi:phosphotransferase system HPr (HPr) family protein
MYERTVEVKLPAGLFARPAATFVQEANRFRGDVFVEKEGKSVNAKSIMGVMSLAIAKGQNVIIRSEGDDEKEAVERLVALVSAEA